MTRHENLKILAFVGLAGSGKSIATEYFAQKGFPKVYFGGVMLQLLEESGLERTPENEKLFRIKLREEKGDDVIVNKIIDQINHLADAGQHRIIADGVYTWSEYKALKKVFPGELVLVAIVASSHIRYDRLAKRPIRPFTAQEAHDRDWAEIENLEKGGPIAIANHYIINEGSLEDFHKSLDVIAAEINFTD